MPDFAEPLTRLIQEFKRLPGIGQKSAQRLAFHVLRGSQEDAERLVAAVLDVKTKLGLCEVCNNISDGEQCPFCRDTNRDRTVLCVVEEPHDILPIETTRQFHGCTIAARRHPKRGLPDQLRIQNLLTRLSAASPRDHPGHEPQRGGEATGLSFAVIEAAGGEGYAHRDGDSRRQRPGVRR
jgi:recombination protein RecR